MTIIDLDQKRMERAQKSLETSQNFWGYVGFGLLGFVLFLL